MKIAVWVFLFIDIIKGKAIECISHENSIIDYHFYKLGRLE